MLTTLFWEGVEGTLKLLYYYTKSIDLSFIGRLKKMFLVDQARPSAGIYSFGKSLYCTYISLEKASQKKSNKN